MTALSRLADRTPPAVTLVVAVVAVSTSAILVRWSTAPSLVKAFYRVTFTLLLLAPFVLAGHRDAMARFGRNDLLVATVTGVALAVHFAAWFESLRYTSVAASVTLVQSQPLFVALGAWFLLEERVTWRTVAGILLALVGVIVMTIPGPAGGTMAGSRPLYGNALAIVGAVMAAAYVLAGRSIRQRVPLLPYVTVVYVACAATLLALSLVRGHPIVAYPPREWLLFLAMAVGPGIFGHTVINWALEHVESSVVSTSLLGEPLGSTLLAALLLQEVPGGGAVAGGIVVLSGIYVTARSRRRRQEIEYHE